MSLAMTVSFSVTVNDPEDYYFKSFLATVDRDEVEDLTVHYPERLGISKSFSNSTKPWVGIGLVPSTSTSVTDK